MKRGIRRVRDSIRRRKNRKNFPETKPTNEYSSLYLPDYEERHGIHEPYMSNQQFHTKGNQLIKNGWVKGTMSLLLFFGLAFILNTDYNRLEKPQQLASHYLQEEFPFAKVNDWYVSTLGNPLALLPEEGDSVDPGGDILSLPVSGNVTEPFIRNGEGIKISPVEDTTVSAFNRGVVIFAGNNRNTKKTVTIQHPDNSKTTYGYLSEIDVHLYQIVKVNDRIGSFYPSKKDDTVYFSIEQNSGFVDPIQVIQVDKTR